MKFKPGDKVYYYSQRWGLGVIINIDAKEFIWVLWTDSKEPMLHYDYELVLAAEPNNLLKEVL